MLSVFLRLQEKFHKHHYAFIYDTKIYLNGFITATRLI